VGVIALKVEARVNPMGIDELNPRFSWQINSTLPNVKQLAYQIVVAGSPNDLNNEKDLVWNSGKVAFDRSLLIPYGGAQLEARKTYYWKVKVWTNKGASTWSNAAFWSMAFTDQSHWKAQWIGMDSTLNSGKLTTKTRLSARYLRKEFMLDTQIKKATLYISGLGMYECYINGKKISNDIFAPTATDYTKRVNYNVFEVTNFLTENRNTIGVILGNGRFFSMRIRRAPGGGLYGFPKLLLQLEIDYQNGGTKTIISDSSWRITTEGPIIANNEYDGEEYDANLEMPGWDNNGFDDSKWRKVQLVDAPKGKLVAQLNPNIATMCELKPIAVYEIEKGHYVIDMGQNMVGWVSAKLTGIKNKTISFKHAELINEDGTVYMDNIRGARTTNFYHPARNGDFFYEPRFVYHGFRYVEIKGIDYLPSVDDFTGKVNYDYMLNTGNFETSDTTINQVYRNACWGIKGNYRSMPTDCPQRDERMGWLGDRAIGCFGESFIFDNQLLYRKWAQDIADAQLESGSLPDIAPAYWINYSDNITWPAAFISVAEMLYQQFGDDKPVKTHYKSMKKWLNYMQEKYMTDYIITRDKYGDWCMPPENPEIIHSKDQARITNGELLSTSYYYRLLLTMAKFATISGNNADTQLFIELAAKVKTAYNKKFFIEEKAQYDNNTVTANIISLMQGIVPEGHEQKVFDNLSDKIEGEFNSHVSVGLIGLQFLMRGLTSWGRSDIAYRLAKNRSYPSWGYMVDNGATTIWELWNGNTADPSMNSGNHVMLLGDLLSWYYEDLAGIKTDKTDVGFKIIIMQPTFPDGLNFVKASHESPYGTIRSEWEKQTDFLKWDITIPANTTAIVTFPATAGSQIMINRKRITQHKDINILKTHKGYITAEVPSGVYSFSISAPNYKI